MRSRNTRIHLEIPIERNKILDNKYCFEDDNGFLYEIDAIKKACKSCKVLPIIYFDEMGKKVIVGEATSIKWNLDTIEVDGVLAHGGTCETCDFDKKNERLVSLNFTAVGLF